MGKNQHVVSYQKKWAVRGEKNEKVTSTHDTQAQAIQRAGEIAINQHSKVVIHRPDGTIRDKDSYGKDPCHQKIKSSRFVFFRIKVRHLLPSSKPKPAFHQHSYLQIEDFLSSFLLMLTTPREKAKLKLKASSREKKKSPCASA